MNPKNILLYLFFFLVGSKAFSQLTSTEKELVAPSLFLSRGINFQAELNMYGLASTEDELPFWLYHNQRGRISSETNFSSWFSGKAVNFFSNGSFLIMGAGAFFDEAAPEPLKPDELYAHYQNSKFYVSIGKKQHPELYNGISSSNRSTLWSLNASPIPGIVIGTTDPVFFRGEDGFGFEAVLAEYFMGNDRYVKGARLHHKKISLVFEKQEWSVILGFNHYAQWAGVNPSENYGKQPNSFEDYVFIFFGQEGGADASLGDQLSALGNHIGGYEFYLNKEFDDFRIQLFYNHLFEDGSGMRLRNTPDGRYGIFLEKKGKSHYINSVIFELYYTLHQSHTINAIHKWDNYFTHGVYKSGWIYGKKVIGAPFFTRNESGLGMVNNKFKAFHLGVSGRIDPLTESYPYKMMLSYSYNEGTPFERYIPKQDVFYVNYEMKFWDEFVELRFQFGAEYNSYASPIYGAGIHLRKEF